MSMYAESNKEWIPREGVRPRNWPNGRNYHVPWACALRPFLDARSKTGYELDDLFELASYYRCASRYKDGHNIHYVVNAMPFTARGVFDQRGVGDELWRRGLTKASSIFRPADVFYIAEMAEDRSQTLYNQWYRNANEDIDVAQFYDIWDDGHVLFGSNTLRVFPRRHGSGSNVSFFDGHAAIVRDSDLQTLNNWDDGIYNYRRHPRD
jgi:prepilin-type processing-associated H-X9-DG protein